MAKENIQLQDTHLNAITKKASQLGGFILSKIQ